MKILIITQWFDPEPTFKGLLFAQKLVSKGHDVEVITGFPNYPGGKVYDGYKIKPCYVEIIDGVKISRVALYPSHDNSPIKRIFNYVSFFTTSCFYGLLKSKNIDVIYSYHPPLTTCLSSVIIGKVRRIPVVFDVQDLWPDTLSATGMIKNRGALKVVSSICDLTYKLATKIVVLSPGFKKKLISRNVPSSKLSVIYNWCDESSLIPKGTCKYRLPSTGFNIVFAGNLGKAQGVNSIIGAAIILKVKCPRVNIVLVGDGVTLVESKKEVKKNELSNVHFIPRVPMRDVADLLSASDALLVHLTADELFEITIPSRTQAYMSVGKPIVMGVKGDAAELITKAECGVTCKPDSPESLAKAIQSLAEMKASDLEKMAINSKSFYESKLSVDIGVDSFINVFKEAIQNG